MTAFGRQVTTKRMYKCPACNNEPVKGAFIASLKCKKQVQCEKCKIYLQIGASGWIEFILLLAALLGTSLAIENYDIGILLEAALLISVAAALHISHVLIAVRLVAE